MIARKGIGRQHAKWSPVSTCIMYKEPVVKLNEDQLNREMTPAQRVQFVDMCPRKVFRYEKDKQAIEIEDSSKCNLCNECFRYAETLKLEKHVKLDEEPEHFNFTVESTGALPPREIVSKAMQILRDKIRFF
mmetsp:Transcript_16370/g.27694  ORF Transcript_16370/g.27694 Transcript_16370/m.27694 type:complete len:132 (-) Transcript_16370:125-520(-)